MKTRIATTIAGLMLACAITANGQQGPDGGGQGGPGGGGPPDMTQMREMMMTRLQKQMDMPDDAFSAIKPQIEKVMQLKRDEMAGMGGRGGPGGGGPGGGMGGPGGGGGPDANGGGGGGNGGPPDMNGGHDGGGPGGGGPGGDQPQSEVRKAQRDLRDAVRESSTDTDTLKAKMQAYRDARAKNHTNLLAAETDLKSVLSVKQEAVLLAMGLLD